VTTSAPTAIAAMTTIRFRTISVSFPTARSAPGEP
jgi:hypothetical protein